MIQKSICIYMYAWVSLCICNPIQKELIWEEVTQRFNLKRVGAFTRKPHLNPAKKSFKQNPIQKKVIGGGWGAPDRCRRWSTPVKRKRVGGRNWKTFISPKERLETTWERERYVQLMPPIDAKMVPGSRRCQPVHQRHPLSLYMYVNLEMKVCV